MRSLHSSDVSTEVVKFKYKFIKRAKGDALLGNT